MCEVLNADGTPHPTNTRAELRSVLERGAAREEPWVGFEQEYTLFRAGAPLGFPRDGYPAPQGPFYCGVGPDRVFGRELVEAHTRACLDAGLMIYGTNAEVMPGQWEFQIGYRGLDGESPDPLTVADHVWLARWLLLVIGERYGIIARFDPKPVKGDWNGAGAHTNFSTRAMRHPHTGRRAIDAAITRLAETHARHIERYGDGLADRLTGLHETCAMDQFRDGVADRGASIRIPRHVAEHGHGYIEDRRPGANCDPYIVCTMLLRTVCARRPSGEIDTRLAVAV
jgi:glutamine synthetase